ncbi:MAG: agmatinase [Candidatus Omnitrophica bacterium]|nr:agmatinase [Candidatus Omnitrophota bacterium]MBU4487497.1 agmatinase [Candidatus Omnitrophota bacterium]MCG2704923.1 agmatinase [Candidatus Omnitrophota bacterium]
MDGKNVSNVRFGGSGLSYVDFEKAKAVIIQAPYEGTVTYRKGTQRGPAAILEASANMEFFDEELNIETYKNGIHTLPPINISNLSVDNVIEEVYKSVKDVMKAEKLPVLLGGEHSVTIGAVRAAKEAAGDIMVLQLDAHYDLRDEYRGSRNNHACVARRIQEMAPLVQLGVRSLSKEEKDFLSGENNVVKTISAYDMLTDQLWDRRMLEVLKDKVYITIDLDVLDPSIMPAVGTPEPGGISWYVLLDILKMVAQNKEIVGFDIVELAPIEGDIAPDFLTSKLIYRLLGYTFFYKNGKKK